MVVSIDIRGLPLKNIFFFGFQVLLFFYMIVLFLIFLIQASRAFTFSCWKHLFTPVRDIWCSVAAAAAAPQLNNILQWSLCTVCFLEKLKGVLVRKVAKRTSKQLWEKSFSMFEAFLVHFELKSFKYSYSCLGIKKYLEFHTRFWNHGKTTLRNTSGNVGNWSLF